MQSPYITESNSLNRVILRHMSQAVKDNFTFVRIDDLTEDHILKVRNYVESKLPCLNITNLEVDVGRIQRSDEQAICITYSAVYFDIEINGESNVFTFKN